MKTLTENYSLSKKVASGLENAIKENDNELIAAYIKDAYVDIFENTQFLNGDELDIATATVDASSDNGDEGINLELRKLNTFMTSHNINYEDEEKVFTEALDDAKLNELLDKAFNLGYSEGFAGDNVFYEFLNRYKDKLTSEESDRLKDAFDNGVHKGDLEDTAPEDEYNDFTDDVSLFEDADVSEDDFEPDDIDSIELVDDNEELVETTKDSSEKETIHETCNVALEESFEPDDIQDIVIK